MTKDRLNPISSRTLAGAAVALALVLPVGVVGAQGTSQQQQACQGDAMRLCGEFIPDVAKIEACMSRKRAQVSAACRAAIVVPSHRHYRRHLSGR
jgi:hypothetical protein